jgi:hypothetical protein
MSEGVKQKNVRNGIPASLGCVIEEQNSSLFCSDANVFHLTHCSLTAHKPIIENVKFPTDDHPFSLLHLCITIS